MLPGLDDAATETALRRLGAEEEIWITTVRSDGQPQTSPVGFLWDGARFTLLSRPGAGKVRNLGGSTRVSLHLELDRTAQTSGGVLSVEGDAVVEAGPLAGAEADRYVAKYGAIMELVGVTRDEFLGDYSTVIRVTPTRVRAY